MNISEQLTKSQQYGVISILIKIMEADGIIDPHEINFINEVLKVFHISEQEMELIDSFDIPKSVSELKVLGRNTKESIVRLFVGMAECDGYADPRELDIIYHLGI
ncbi:MAG: TerB family tellurite resistance protein [Duncaniella sp.]|nr:TerB family tellurite resistance protein [Duncaniella sp.]